MTPKPRPTSSLSKLRKSIYSEQEIFNTLNALGREKTRFADYAIAIIGSSYLERAIEISMKGRFVDLTADEERGLFSEASSPLGDFSARIRVGFAMYLFGRETRDDLETVRRIRNLFAHQPAILTFETPQIEAACKSISVLERPSTARRSQLTDGRDHYIAACVELARRIQMAVLRRSAKWDPRWAKPKAPRDLP